MTKEVIKDKEFSEGIKAGIDLLADAVKDTFGPMGRTVIIKNPFGEMVVTKDGVSVAESIELDPDTIEAIGANLVKNVALKVNNLVGDGTTTASVLAQAIYSEGLKQLALGREANEFKKGIKIASIDLLKAISKERKSVTTDDETLKSVAMVSSNNDEGLASMITEIYEELGTNAVISLDQGNSLVTEYNVVKGMHFDRGYLSPYGVTDKIKMKIEHENPLILIYDGKISEFKQIYAAVEYAGSKGRPLIIVAENVQESALRGLVVNHAAGNVHSAVVMSPGYGNKRVERLRDMAIMFNAQVVDKETTPENFNPDDLGECKKVEITSTDSAFIGGAGSNEEIEARAKFIESQIEHYAGNKYEIDILETRLGKLTGGVAVIKIGAATKEEGKEIFDRAEDCKHAVKAALQEGVVEGGGMALFNAAEKLEKIKFKSEVSESLQAGYLTMLRAAREPFRQIIRNSGKIPEVIESKLGTVHKGYDVRKDTYVKTMKAAEIIDPYKVVRIALESSVSIVGTLLTSNYAIINEDDTTTKTFQ